MDPYLLHWRGAFTNAELNALHAEAFTHDEAPVDWVSQVSRHSLGWVTARQLERLVGFVNVAWDGGVHAFILDAAVASSDRRAGVGASLIALARDHARDAGCAWLHVDFADALAPFYFTRCGFAPTSAGLIALRPNDAAG